MRYKVFRIMQSHARVIIVGDVCNQLGEPLLERSWKSSIGRNIRGHVSRVSEGRTDSRC